VRSRSTSGFPAVVAQDLRQPGEGKVVRDADAQSSARPRAAEIGGCLIAGSQDLAGETDHGFAVGSQRYRVGVAQPTAEALRHPRGAFAALTSRSYRIYLCGQGLANTGTWMQSIARDWLVFDLTHSSTAVGVTMALQFLPIMALGLHAGLIADRLSKRRILLTTQALNAVATAALAAITLAGLVHAADVYAFALLSGLIFAFDAPSRQAFVAEVAPPDQLRAAIALNGAVFQATRLIGPALASLLIASAGTGWVFAVNAACYLGPTIGLLRLRPADLLPAPSAPRTPGALRTSARYLRRHPDVVWMIAMVGVFGTFGLNFPIVLTAMAKSAFHGDASMYGLFNMALAVGSVAGGLLAGASSRCPRRANAAYRGPAKIDLGSLAVNGGSANVHVAPDRGQDRVRLGLPGGRGNARYLGLYPSGDRLRHRDAEGGHAQQRSHVDHERDEHPGDGPGEPDQLLRSDAAPSRAGQDALGQRAVRLGRTGRRPGHRHADPHPHLQGRAAGSRLLDSTR
jgi:MFS family permease